jgi:hypothetical protein
MLRLVPQSVVFGEVLKALTTEDTEHHRGNPQLINVDLFDALH